MFNDRFAPIALLCLSSSLLSAQAIPVQTAAAISEATSVSDAGPAGIIPLVKGPNLSLTTSSQHDSTNGWSSVLSPDFAWRFDRHFSADVDAPIYASVNVVVTGGTKAKPTYTSATKHFVMGDTLLNGHYEVEASVLSYNLTGTLGLPSGSKSDGLGSGQVTYSFNNHFEKNFEFFTPDIELGIGDSSATQGARIRKSYTTVGTLAYFQAGGAFDLPLHSTFEADAYESLPISGQTLYSTTGKGKKKVTTATSSGIAEDNGFTTSLDIPLSGHVTLSGLYNRSLRSHIDTAGFSLTFLMKAPPREPGH